MGVLKAPYCTTAQRLATTPGNEVVYDTDLKMFFLGEAASGNWIPWGPVSRDVVYGVRWAHTASSPTLTKGYLVKGQFISNTYTTYPIQDRMRRCVLNASAQFKYYLDGINIANTTSSITGTNTSTDTGKLIDSGQTFSTKGVAVGQWVKNTATGICAIVTAVDSETQLSLNWNIFPSSSVGYEVGTANPQVAGCVMVETAYFYYVWIVDGNYTFILISRSPFIFYKPSDGSIVVSQLHPWFMEGGVFANVKYTGAFESIWYSTSASAYTDHNGSTVGVNGDKAVSLPGYKPLTYQYRRSATTYTGFAGLHAAFGSLFHTQGFFAYEALWILMITEWGTLNGQTALPGYTNASVWSYAYTRKTGRTIGLGNSSGSVMVDLTGLDSDLSGILGSGNAVANSFHGVENPFGHIWKWVDGANFNWVSNGGKVYLSNNPSSWAEDTATGYQDTGLLLPAAVGYISALFEGRLLPSSVTGGGSSYYLCDYFYQPGASAGWRGLFVGGSLYNGASAGPAYLYASNSGSGDRSAPIGGRAAC